MVLIKYRVNNSTQIYMQINALLINIPILVNMLYIKFTAVTIT